MRNRPIRVPYHGGGNSAAVRPAGCGWPQAHDTGQTRLDFSPGAGPGHSRHAQWQPTPMMAEERRGEAGLGRHRQLEGVVELPSRHFSDCGLACGLARRDEQRARGDRSCLVAPSGVRSGRVGRAHLASPPPAAKVPPVQIPTAGASEGLRDTARVGRGRRQQPIAGHTTSSRPSLLKFTRLAVMRTGRGADGSSAARATQRSDPGSRTPRGRSNTTAMTEPTYP